MSQVAKWIGNGLVAMVVLALLFFFLTPHLLGMNFFTIYSGSMSPAISVGSVVAAHPVEASDIEVGDIIAFKRPGGADNVVAHRVIEALNDNGAISFRTAGDSNAAPDGSAVPAENVIGRIWFHLPFLGYLSTLVRTELGFILLVCVPGIIIVSLEVRNIITELRSMEQLPQWQPLNLVKRLPEQPLPVTVLNNPTNPKPVTVELSKQETIVRKDLSLWGRRIMDQVSSMKKLPHWQLLNPVERLPEQSQSLPVANDPTNQRLAVVEPSKQVTMPDIKSEVMTPRPAPTTRVVAEVKRKPEIEAEAARIVAEIKARIRAPEEGTAESKSSLNPEPKARTSAQAIAARIVAEAMTKSKASVLKH